MAVSAVTVGTTPTALGSVPYGGFAVFQNVGSTVVAIGDSASLTFATGIQLAPASGTTPGGSATLDHPNPNFPAPIWYAIVESDSGTVNVVLEN